MDRLSISVHEVAHAVAIEALTASSVRFAEVVGDHRGAAFHTGMATTVDVLVSCVSGRIGEAVVLGGWPGPADNDWRMARLAIAVERGVDPEHVGLIELTPENRSTERRIRTYFTPRIALIRGLADRLYADGRIEGEVVRDALVRFDERQLQARRAALCRFRPAAMDNGIDRRAIRC